jgi:hypothetical protein
MDDFTQGYIDCAVRLFHDTDDEGNEISIESSDLFSEALLNTIQADCKAFQETYADLLALAYQNPRYNPSKAGHDFFLTRNRHGSGFWDSDLDELVNQGELAPKTVGTLLTDAAHAYGSFDLYMGDNGEVYGH